MSGNTIDFASARVMLARGEAEFAKMKDTLARGEPITVEAFHEMVAVACEHIGARMLQLPAEIVPFLVFDDPAAAVEAEAIIRHAVWVALRDLAADANEAFPEDGPANEPQPAA